MFLVAASYAAKIAKVVASDGLFLVASASSNPLTDAFPVDPQDLHLASTEVISGPVLMKSNETVDLQMGQVF